VHWRGSRGRPGASGGEQMTVGYRKVAAPPLATAPFDTRPGTTGLLICRLVGLENKCGAAAKWVPNSAREKGRMGCGVRSDSDMVLQGTPSESKKRKVNGSLCKSTDDLSESCDEENPFAFPGKPAMPQGPSSPQLDRHMKKKKKKKMTTAAITSERADKAERPSYALRQRDAAGLAVSTVCPDVICLCTKLREQVPAPKGAAPLTRLLREQQEFLCETCRVQHWQGPTRCPRGGCYAADSDGMASSSATQQAHGDELMQPGSGLAPTLTTNSIHGAMAAAASAKKGAPVDPDTLMNRRVLDMPVPGYGKFVGNGHNGTVTKVHQGARRIIITITFDDHSKHRFDLSRVLKYLQDLAVGSDARAEEADRSAAGSGHELGDAQSADGEGAEASSLGFDQAQRTGESGGNVADDDKMESEDGSSRVRPVCRRLPGAVVQALQGACPCAGT
jgi:hypothetical protein